MESWWRSSGWCWPGFWKQAQASSTSRYWLTREVFMRSLAVIYLVAFAIAFFQSPGLLGEDGILPIPSFLRRMRDKLNICDNPTRADWRHPLDGCTHTEVLGALTKVPTLLWFDCSDAALNLVSSTGITFSLFVAFGFCHNAPTMFLLWALYQSLVSSGQLFYGYGWESQVSEAQIRAQHPLVPGHHLLSSPLLSFDHFP